MRRHAGWRHVRGVTLVELVVTLAVLAVLATLAAPAFRDLLRRHQVGSAAEALRNDLAYARHEAVQRASFVSLCPSSTGDDCADDGSYRQGWMVYAYPSGALGANRRYAAGSPDFTRLRYTTPSAPVIVNASDAKVVTFGQQGQFKSTSERSSVTWHVCALDGRAGEGESTAGVPGVQLTLLGSGSVQRQALAAGERCLPAS